MRLVCSLLSVALALSAQDQPINAEKEAALGKALADEVRKNTTPLKSDIVHAYVQQLGARLAAQLPQQPAFPYNFEAIAQSDGPAPLEAFSLPGGYVFVPSDLILGARDQAEFAGMLAHAVVHIAEHHLMRTADKSDGAQLATMPMIFLEGYGTLPGMGMPIGSLSGHRARESEADLIAVKLVAATGYDPEGFVNFIAPVQDAPGSANFSPYPPRDERIQAMRKVIAALPPKTYTSSDDFAQVQQEVRRLTPKAARPSLQKAPTLYK